MLRIAIVGSAALSLVLLAASAEARDRRGDRYHVDRYDVDGSAGRNAAPAIAYGLAGMAAGWIDTIGNAYADPVFRNADYFDYYRRRSYGAVRPSRR